MANGLPELRPFDIGPALASFDSGVATSSRLAEAAARREAQGRERQGHSAMQEAGKLLASGDRAGAESALLRAGRIGEANTVREQGVKEDERARAKKLEMTDKLLGAVYGVDDSQKYQQILTSFAQENGMDPTKILAENPFDQREANIRELAGAKWMMEQEAKKKPQNDYIHVGNRIVRTGPNGVEEVYAPPPDPLDAMIAERLQQSMNGGGATSSAAPATPPARYIPQSYQTPMPAGPTLQSASAPSVPPQVGGPPQLAPGITLAADSAPAPVEETETEEGTPVPEVEERGASGFNPGDVYGKPGDAMVETPLGKMTRGEARTLAAGLSKRNPGLSRMMIDSAGANPSEMTKAARNTLDKNEINTTEHLSSLYSIRESFNPSFLQTKNQAAAWGLNLKEKLTGQLTPEQQKFVGDYASFVADAATNINQQLKILSGTAVSDQEYRRNLLAAPDPGLQGWFSGDGATAFKSKLDRAVQVQERAVRRQRLLRAEGFKGKPWEAFPLEQTDTRINNYARDLEKRIKQQFPNAQPDDIHRAVKDKLKQDIYL